MKSKTWGWMTAAMVVLGAGCTPEDAAPPAWEVVVNGRLSGAHIELSGGELIAFVGDASDDVELAEAVLRLEPKWMHPELADGFAVTVGDWQEEHRRELEGTAALVGRNWVVPDSLRGDWALFAELSDALGQTTPVQTVHFTFDNPGPAAFTIDSLQGLATATLPPVPTCQAGLPLNLVGDVFDPDGLNAVSAMLVGADGTVHGTWEWETPGGILCDLAEVDLVVPEATACTVYLQVLDGSLRSTRARFQIAIE